MACVTLNKAPTAFEELRILESIYLSADELHGRLSSYGYRILTDVKIPEVRCFLFVTHAFPLTTRETANFDFARHAGRAMTVGICIGGTTISSGQDTKLELLLQGLMKATEDYHKANVACTQILRALMSLEEVYPQLSAHEVSLKIHVCGYSLGGLFAQATTVLLHHWAECEQHTITCRTYDCPGVQEHYHEMARNCCADRPSPWKKIITNYKSMPGPLNTVFKDIGCVVHLYNPESIEWDAIWLTSCISGSLKRATFWTSWLESFGTVFLSSSSSVFSLTMKRIAMGMAIMAELGISAADVVHHHKLSTMMECFDGNGRLLPYVGIEMEVWPVYNDFKDKAAELLARSGIGLIPFSPENPGLHTLFGWGGKRGFVERKLTSLPGYLPATQRRSKMR